jgi:signal transduction histidine kinase
LKAHYGPLLITFPQAPISRDWVTGRAFLDRKTIQVEDLREVAEEYPLGYATGMRAGFRTVMAVPLLREGEAIGAIAIRRREVAPFTQKQINLVTTFADQAVIAIENARLFEEVQRRNRELRVALEQQTATSDLLKVIGRSTFDLQPVFDALAESAVRLCEAERAFVFRFDGELLRAVAWHNPSPELLAFVTAHPIRLGRETIAARAGLERKTVHVHDVQADPERTYATRDIDPIRTVLAVPMLRGDELLGVTVIYRVEVRPFATSHIALMETFSDQAVIAIENVRLFEEVQARTAELARSVGELKALGEVSQAVNSTLDSKIVLETIVAKAVQLSETHGGAIYVYDASSKAFSLRATYGMDEALIAAIASRPMTINDVGIGDAARQRRPIQMPDLENEKLSPAADIVLKAGFRAVLIVPLLSGDDIAGALVVRRRSTGEFPQATVDLMQTFAAQSAQAIQNARLFSEIEEKSRELEIASRHKSQFLANMSHELRTPLNSVLGFTEMLVDGLYGDLPEKAKTTLGRVQANGRHLLGLINDVLDLSKIEAGQLKLAIDDYIVGQIVKTVEAATEPLARNKGLVLSVDIAAGLPRGRGDERRLTQVLLNLAGNAVKFTDKGSIAISARAANGCFEFLVKDTGPGIAPEHQSRIFEEFQQVDDSNTRQKGGSGLGLAISRRIVELHGGKIGVESEPGRGSTFRVEIPINAGEAMKGS